MSEQLSKHINTTSAERILREFEKEFNVKLVFKLVDFELTRKLIAFAYEQGRNDGELNK